MGIHHAFAINYNTSIDSLTIISEDNNPTNTDDEIYENTDCFVIAGVNYITKIYPHSILPFFNGDIGFGGYLNDTSQYFISKGFIYTDGSQGKWIYNGKFIGDNGRVDIRWYSDPKVFEVYIGVKGFKGLIFGDFFRIGLLVSGIIIGNADSVKIETILR